LRVALLIPASVTTQHAAHTDNGFEMRKSVRKVLYRFVPSRILLPYLLLWKGPHSRLFSTYGWARSVRRMLPIDENDEPLPWVPYCMVDLLKERLTSRMRVLEFGAGYSTLFFMNRVAHISSIEHHHIWLDWVRARVNPNVTLIPTNKASAAEYCAPITGSDDRFDLIMVDGIHRPESFRVALQRLTPAGVIILDDSHRPDYANVFNDAAAAGLRFLHMRGHKAGSIGLYRSTVFYRDGNCLGI
jgi:SAM-dependent methyltransferase